MDKIRLEMFKNNYEKYVKKILNGDVFIYPTDTVYGIGCDATNKDAVETIRRLKQRPKKAMSVIAPSKEWIIQNTNCDIKDLDFLPGKFTLIFTLSNTSCIAKNVTTKKIGVRIPDHPISDFVKKVGKPIITTSANISGQPTIKDWSDTPPSFKDKVKFFVSQGNITAPPSKVIDMETGTVLR